MYAVGNRVRVIKKDVYSQSGYGSWGYVTHVYRTDVTVRFEHLVGKGSYPVPYEFTVRKTHVELMPLTKLEKALK